MNGRRRRSRDLFWGLLLITLGTIFLLEQMQVMPGIAWERWWPGFVILFGLDRLLRPAHAGHVGSGVSFLLLGLWFFAVEFGYRGLEWHNSWPLALVAMGAGIVARAIATRFMPDRGEVHDV
jgi:hypothetical protein